MQFASLKRRNLHVTLEPRVAREIGGMRVMQGMRGDFPTGRTAEFFDGFYTTNDPKEIELLKSHVHYGVDFVAVDDNEPVVPTAQAVAEQNEKAQIKDELAATCPVCGNKFKNSMALKAHSRTHK